MKPAMKIARPRTSDDAETQLQDFIDKFDSNQQATIRAVRKGLRQRLPSANELVYDNYNFFVIGYSSIPQNAPPYDPDQTTQRYL
jgi:hypothetical protein